MFADIAPHDAAGVLRHEWLNSRGAIARFDRQTIEIRLIDTQECAAADMAVARAIVAVVRTLYDGLWLDPAILENQDGDRLAAILWACVHDGEGAIIEDREFLGVLLPDPRPCSARELWWRLLERCQHRIDDPLAVILERGTLARRLLQAGGPYPSRQSLRRTYAELCHCLAQGRSFRP